MHLLTVSITVVPCRQEDNRHNKSLQRNDSVLWFQTEKCRLPVFMSDYKFTKNQVLKHFYSKTKPPLQS